MQTVRLYRYERPEGGITTSLNQPEGVEYTIKHRLIADEGKLLSKDGIETPCIDTDDVTGWIEVNAPQTEEPELLEEPLGE